MFCQKECFRLGVLVFLAIFLLGMGCDSMNVNKAGDNRVRFEHIGINVQDPVKMADWWVKNLDMKIKRQGEPPVSMRFLSDTDENMMIEIYHNPPEAVPEYASMDPLLLHIAFKVDDVKAIQDKLIAAGATLHSYQVTPDGDEILILRDPWGVPIQFVKRANVMLSFE